MDKYINNTMLKNRIINTKKLRAKKLYEMQ